MEKLQFPRARVDCLARDFYGEVLVYDPKRYVGHCLNSTAGAVWRLCDGKTSPRQIAEELSRKFSTPVAVQLVRVALRRLAEAHLLILQQPVGAPSRREAIKKIGKAAAIALPLITSVVAPGPATAASCFHNLHACTANPQCCSNLCLLNKCVGG